MTKLTLQAFIQAQWQDIAYILFPLAENGNYQVTQIEYLSDYALVHHQQDDYFAASLNYPVALFFDDGGEPGWLPFLDDIIPSGASRRYWMKFLDIQGLTESEQNYVLLKFGTMSPIGHLRIKESVPEHNELAESLYFSVEDVKNRTSDFLDYAQQRGAVAGGATGAGGEAPKLVLRCGTNNQVWIDSQQNTPLNQDPHYLVKYPRGARREVDCNILRAEYHYYQQLAKMGFDTIPTQNMRLEEGRHNPSLWLPRFDVEYSKEGVSRYAMESVYSILGKEPGTQLDHEVTIRTLINKIQQSHMVTHQGYEFDMQAFVIEWVKRDLLNIIFGNSDNHGRNTSFMRGKGVIKLAPIYDFAPMKADPEGIPRTTKWATPLEIGGQYDFVAIADTLTDLVPSKQLLRELKILAKQCLNLKQDLELRGVPQQILTMPAIGFDFIEQKFTKWGLL